MKKIDSLIPWMKNEEGGYRRRAVVVFMGALLQIPLFFALMYLSVIKRDLAEESIVFQRWEPLDRVTPDDPPDQPPEKTKDPTPAPTKPVFPDQPPPEAPTKEPDDSTKEPLIDYLSPVKLIRFKSHSQTGEEIRKQVLKKFNPKLTAKTEPAVEAALEWLRKNQQADGSWESDRPVGITGLGLLTFLAHGETLNTEIYGPTVEKAMRYLVKSQNEAGWFDKSGHAYSHAIATYAISEAYALTRIPMLRDSMDRGVAIIVDGISLEPVDRAGSRFPVPGLDDDSGPVTAGMWDYQYKQSGRWDLSFTGWQIQALKAARMAGSRNLELNQTLAAATNGILAWQKESTGRFGYSKPGEGSWTMTSVGTLSLQLLGFKDASETRRGLKALEDATCDFNNPVNTHPMYNWYYLTQAKFHAGKKTFEKWNKQFAPAFVASQEKDGHWASPVDKENTHGKAYTTSLSALSLMVYYRNLWTFKNEAVEQSASRVLDKESDIDVGFEES